MKILISAKSQMIKEEEDAIFKALNDVILILKKPENKSGKDF